MTRNRPATAEERARMGHRLITAADLGDRHHGRRIRIGDVEGTLTGSFTIAGVVNLAVIVGGARAWFALEPGAAVEVWRAAP